MIPELPGATEIGRRSVDWLVRGRPANGGKPADSARAYQDALVLQESAFQERIAVAAETAARPDDAVAGHAGRPAGPHDGAHRSPGAWTSRHHGHVAIGGDPPSRNPAHDMEYQGLECTAAAWRSGALDFRSRHKT